MNDGCSFPDGVWVGSRALGACYDFQKLDSSDRVCTAHCTVLNKAPFKKSSAPYRNLGTKP